jgi:hypothetical protein
VQLVELDEIVGELVAERDLALRKIPARAGLAAHAHLDGKTLAPGISAGERRDVPHDIAGLKCLLEDVERAFRLAEHDRVLHRLQLGRAQERLERLVP